MIAENLRRIVGKEWVLDSESERRPYESDGLAAYRVLPLLVVLPQTTAQIASILWYCHTNGIGSVAIRTMGGSVMSNSDPWSGTAFLSGT
jgi:glycolate oxidase